MCVVWLAAVASPWVGGPSRRRLAGAGRRKPKPPRRGEVAVAEPWVGVDSSKPPRLFATVVALVAGGGLATPERLVGALAGISHIPEGLGEGLPKTGKFACPLVAERYAGDLWGRDC